MRISFLLFKMGIIIFILKTQCLVKISSVQFSSVAQSCPTLFDPMCSTPGLPVHHQLPELLKLMSMKSVLPSNHLTLCRPLLLPLSIFPIIRVFYNDSVLCIKCVRQYLHNHLIYFFTSLTNQSIKSTDTVTLFYSARLELLHYEY